VIAHKPLLSLRVCVLGLCNSDDTNCHGYTNSDDRKAPTGPCVIDLPQHNGGKISNDRRKIVYFRRTQNLNSAASTTEEGPKIGTSASSSTSRRTTTSQSTIQLYVPHRKVQIVLEAMSGRPSIAAESNFSSTSKSIAWCSKAYALLSPDSVLAASNWCSWRIVRGERPTSYAVHDRAREEREVKGRWEGRELRGWR
jgi:hypothetical protein